MAFIPHHARQTPEFSNSLSLPNAYDLGLSCAVSATPPTAGVEGSNVPVGGTRVAQPGTRTNHSVSL